MRRLDGGNTRSHRGGSASARIRYALFAAMFLAATFALADTSHNARLVGKWNGGGRGPAHAVAASGTTAYLGEGRYLKILDISDPRSPRLLGQIARPDTIECIVPVGNYLYVGGWGPAFGIIDVSDPAAPVEVGNAPTLPPQVAAVLDVTVTGKYAYLASAGLLILDVSNPHTPELVGRLGTFASGVVVTGNYAYVVGDGLKIVDVSDPREPVEVGSFETSGPANAVAVSGTLAFVTEYPAGLSVIDVSDPRSPRLIGSLDESENFWDDAPGITVSGSLLYIAYGFLGLRVVDVSDPAAPREVGSRVTGGYAQQVSLHGSSALLADSQGLRILDISDPTAPTETGSYYTPGMARNVQVSGNLVFIADDDAGLRIIDVSHPETPVEIGSLHAPGRVASAAVSGARVFLANEGSGLRIVDVADPSAPAELGLLESPYISDVAVANNIAYQLDGTRLQTVDVSDPSSPLSLGQLDCSGPFRLAVSGQSVIVAEYRGLRIIDASHPVSPVNKGYFGIPGLPWDVTASGRRAFVVNDEGLHIVDVGDRSKPREIGFLDMPTQALGVDVAGTRAFVVDLNAGLRIVDVSHPRLPVEVGFYDPALAGFGSVAVSGRYAYVAAGYEGLLVIDVNEDADTDSVPDWIDNCPSVANPDQSDVNGDGTGDRCDLMLVAPADGAALPGSSRAPAFQWRSKRFTAFRVEFSADPAFTGSSPVVGSNVRSNRKYTPGREKWNAIRDLAPAGQPIYWRVLGKDGTSLEPSAQTFSFSIVP